MTHRLRYLFAVTILAAGGALAPSSPATAAPVAEATETLAPNAVDLSVHEDGVAALSEQVAGPVTFRVTTANLRTALGLIRLHDGVPLERVTATIPLLFAKDRAVAIAAGREFVRDVDQFGGVVLTPGIGASFTTVLPPDRYYFVDYHRIEEGVEGVWVQPLTVVPGKAGPSPSPVAAITIGSTRFRAPARMKAGAPFRATNTGDQPNEALFIPVRPGTTREEVQAYFTAYDAHEPPPSNPFTSSEPVGVGPISAGRTTIVSTQFQPGDYLLVTYFPNFATSHLLASEGMFELVTLTP